MSYKPSYDTTIRKVYMHALAEYIWMDGGSEDSPVQTLRSKSRVINIDYAKIGSKRREGIVSDFGLGIADHRQ